MARWAVLAVVGLVVSVPGCGSKAAGPIVLGGNAGQRALMHRILDGVGATRLTRVRILPVVPPWRDHHARNAVMLRIRAPHRSVRTQWEAQLLAAVFRDRSAALAFPEVAAVEYPGAGEGFFEQSTREPQKATAAKAAALRKRVRSAAERAGAAISELEAPLPYGVALEVVLKVPRPAAFLHHRLEGFLNIVRREWEQREGDYLGVVDLKGHFVWAWGTTTRMSSGIEYVVPRLQSCDPIVRISVPLHYNPPPCPA